jgi:hypothetical protein
LKNLDSDGWDDFVPSSTQLTSSRFQDDQTGRFAEHTQATGIYLRKPTIPWQWLTTTSDGDGRCFASLGGWWWRENDPVTEYLWKTTATGHRCQRRCRDNSLVPVLSFDNSNEHIPYAHFTTSMATATRICFGGRFEFSQVLD